MGPKKVLLLSIFHPELHRGGAQQVCYELFQGLQADPDVAPILLAAVDHTQQFLYKAGASITGFDGRPNEFVFLSQAYDYWWHRTHEPRLVGRFADFLLETEPDVVHFHHFMLFGADLLSLTRNVLPRARIILTLHEFMAMCAADGQMIRTGSKALCDRPSSVRCHQCFPGRAPEEFTLRKMWFQRHLSMVDDFVCPSNFMVDRYIRWGLPRERVHVIANGQENYAEAQSFSEALAGQPARRRNRFGFFGQLIDNKGVLVILEAVTLLRQRGFTNFVVEINGANITYSTPEHRKQFEDFMEGENAREPEDRLVFYNGGYSVHDLGQRMGRVDWCIVPSIWWEIFVLVITEAWMFGRPVIFSNVGAMAERVRDGVDGLSFNVGDARSLADTMQRAATETGLWGRLSQNIRREGGRDAMVAGYKRLYLQQPALKRLAEEDEIVGFIEAD